MQFSNNTVLHTRSFPLISPTTMLTILSILLVALPLSLSDPICQDPPPSSSLIPTLSDCEVLVHAIFAIAGQQYDRPVHWTKHPSEYTRGQLPKTYNFPLRRNDCEFVVNTIQDNEDDTFPTRVIAAAANRIVGLCLDEDFGGRHTIGSEVVGPKGVIAVAMRKKPVNEEMVSGGLHPLNLINVTLSKPGGSSGLSSS